jgi:hypothetical protein
MKQKFAWSISLFLTLAGVAMVILLSERNTWSSSATTWALTAVLAAPTVVDIAVVRMRKRAARRRGARAAHPAK